MIKQFRQFLEDEDGPTAVEYAVMLALIVGAAMAGITLFGEATAASFDDSATQIDNAFNGADPAN